MDYQGLLHNGCILRKLFILNHMYKTDILNEMYGIET
jgi:hypothetical protein